MRPREFFYSEQQWKRYCLAYKFGSKLKQYQDKGYLIIDEDGNNLKGKIELPEKNEWSVVRIVSDRFRLNLVDLEWWQEGKYAGKPWITSLKNIRAIFKDYKIVNPKDIQKLKL